MLARHATRLLSVAVWAVTFTGAAAPQQPDETRLTPDKPVRRQLSAGQSHVYAINLRAGEYLDAVIEQKGIDVAISLVDPVGRVVREYDSPTGALGPEQVRCIAAIGGNYRFEVRALQPEADRGAYEIRIAALRAATEADRKTEAAVNASASADRLRAVGETRAQSIEEYNEARRLWQAAGDRAGEASTLRALGFAYVRLKQDPAAFEVFTESQRMFRELRDKRAEAYIYLILSNIYTRQGDLAKSLESTELALPLWRAARDREQEAFTLAALGTTHARLGDRAQMARWHRDALRVARSTRRPALVAAMFQSEGGAAEILGDRKHALAAYRSALKLWRQAGHSRGETAMRARIEELERPPAL
jgi:tetratricopeptide (TPR) repeat protein